ncbi:M6 family metalloprotease domain-containing protein [Xylanibacter muris]|uniref:M6 family metalloprotease domain-containing protein n=1 Tax=Xylanibacter muris TaxID=2736290 RepID=A0ABX2AJD2_9BACT|nr:M6 family metalloprotease domain-containing protein [Xylanibacter muris]NPD91130.1 M6 family metalloprotease domain-containing protein [Xylanibacter muris]
MKRILSVFILFALAAGTFAVPAKRGIWKNLKLADGSQVRACLQGDDMVHFYQTEQGDCYVADTDGIYRKTDKESLTAYAKARRKIFDRGNRARTMKLAGGTGKVYEGKKKGLIILVQFEDKAFKEEHDLNFYKRLANEPGFTTPDGFNGSVKDYFKDQSLGRLEVDFDVVGPVTMPNPYAYYGKNVGISGDAHVGEMVAEACKAIDGSVNFADYDWDGDGEVDQVFALYAGFGEASGGSANTIWPHKWTLDESDYGRSITLDNVKIDTYACSCEMTLDNENDFKEVVDGIGTICHEFSHCLGYPDMYDTSQFGTKNFGMDVWDLMDYGSYNNGGYTPSGYTAYEKWVAGWITPVELTENTQITDLKPLSQGGNAYIIYNSGNNDEFIMFENRKQTGWDAAQPASGLMALHVDYDASVWNDNTVNNNEKRQRCTIFHADNSDGTSKEDLAGDLFPYNENNSLNSISFPKPLWYAPDANGHKCVGKSLSDITLDDNGNISFKFSNTAIERDDYLLLETFDENSSTGGNDGIWQGQGGDALITDLNGWSGIKQYAGAQCARFGTKSTPGSLTSPEFEAEQGAELTCLAGPWANEESTMTVSFISSVTGEETILGTFDIVNQEWKKCELKITVSGKGRLKFASSMRQFLDEVRVSKPVTDGIESLTNGNSQTAGTRVYSIDGRYLGDDISVMGHGLYITGGKKVLK